VSTKKVEARLRLLEAELREFAERLASLSADVQRALAQVDELRKEAPSV
jgi:hypothetical protein